MAKPKLLDQVRDAIRVKPYSRRRNRDILLFPHALDLL